jgi:hypothetical protein
MEMLGDRLGRVDDECQVRRTPFSQGTRHANGGGIAVAQHREIGSRPQAAPLNQPRDSGAGNMTDIAASGPQLLNLGPINAEAEISKPSSAKQQVSGSPA